MACVFHPDRPEAGACEGCRRLVCDECRAPHEGRALCPVCRRRAAAGAPLQPPAQARVAARAGSTPAGPSGPARPTSEQPAEPDGLLERWHWLVARPAELFASLADGSRAADWGFFLSAAWPSAALIVTWRMLFRTLLSGSGVSPRYLGMALIVTLLAPAILGALVLFWAVVSHVTLLLLGGARGSFAGTQRVALHALAAHYLVGWVPFVGAVVGLIWSSVLGTIGLRAMHRTDTFRAALAAVMPVLICCGAVLLLVFVSLAALTGLR